MARELPAAWRSLPWRPVAGATTGAALLLAAPVVWPGSVMLPIGIWAGFALLATAVAFLLDEPAAEVVRAVPLRVWRWQLQRVVVALVPLTVGVVGLGAVAARAEPVSWTGTALVLAGILVATVAASASLLARNPVPGALVGESAGLLVLVAGLLNPLGRWVDVLPVEDTARWDRTLLLWLCITALSAAVLVRARRDPPR